MYPNCNGVTFVLNQKYTISGNQTQFIVIIPGRAILLKHPWHTFLTLRILNVYAPNTLSKNAAFWNTLHLTWDKLQLLNPDIVCGDFNMVEDTLNHLPCHTNPLPNTSSLIALREHLHAHNGWCDENPNEKNFTFL